MSVKLKSPNGKAMVEVSDSQAERMRAMGFKDVKAKKANNDRKPSKKSEDTAKTKAISEVEPGETRTR